MGKRKGWKGEGGNSSRRLSPHYRGSSLEWETREDRQTCHRRAVIYNYELTAQTPDRHHIRVSYQLYIPRLKRGYPWLEPLPRQDRIQARIYIRHLDHDYTSVSREVQGQGKRDVLRGIKTLLAVCRKISRLREQGKQDQADLLYLRQERLERRRWEKFRAVERKAMEEAWAEADRQRAAGGA